MRSHGKHLVGRASFETRAGAHCRTQPRTSPVVSNAEAFVVSGCSCHFGGAPGGNATNVQRTRKQRSKGGARVRKRWVDRARLDACIGNRRLYNARHVARICSNTHIKGVNLCREHRNGTPPRSRGPASTTARGARPAAGPRPTGTGDPGAAGPRLSAPGSRPWRAQAATRARTSTKTPPPHT